MVAALVCIYVQEEVQKKPMQEEVQYTPEQKIGSLSVAA